MKRRAYSSNSAVPFVDLGGEKTNFLSPDLIMLFNGVASILVLVEPFPLCQGLHPFGLGLQPSCVIVRFPNGRTSSSYSNFRRFLLNARSLQDWHSLLLFVNPSIPSPTSWTILVHPSAEAQINPAL